MKLKPKYFENHDKFKVVVMLNQSNTSSQIARYFE